MIHEGFLVLPESIAWDSEEAEFGLFGYPCLVSLSLDRAWMQISLGLGFLTRDCDIRERGWARPKETKHWQSGRSLGWAGLEEHKYCGKSSSLLEVRLPPPLQGLRCVNSGIIFAGQGQEKGGQKNHKDLHGVRIRGRMVRAGRGNRNFLIPHLGRKLSTLMSATSLARQFDFEVSSFCTGPDVRWSLPQT